MVSATPAAGPALLVGHVISLKSSIMLCHAKPRPRKPNLIPRLASSCGSDLCNHQVGAPINTSYTTASVQYVGLDESRYNAYIGLAESAFSAFPPKA
jgi:hypothetical protein